MHANKFSSYVVYLFVARLLSRQRNTTYPPSFLNLILWLDSIATGTDPEINQGEWQAYVSDWVFHILLYYVVIVSITIAAKFKDMK